MLEQHQIKIKINTVISHTKILNKIKIQFINKASLMRISTLNKKGRPILLIRTQLKIILILPKIVSKQKPGLYTLDRS